MKNISKRIACVALSLLCVFMSTYTVYADNSGESNWEHLSNGHVIVNGVEYEPMEEKQVVHEVMYILNKLGVFGKIEKGILDFGFSLEILSNSGTLVRDDSGNIYMKADRKTEDEDNIKFGSDYVNSVRNGIANIIQTEDGFFYMPTTNRLVPDSYLRNEDSVVIYNNCFKPFVSGCADNNYLFMNSGWTSGILYSDNCIGYSIPYSYDFYVEEIGTTPEKYFIIGFGNGTVTDCDLSCRGQSFTSMYGNNYSIDGFRLYASDLMIHTDGEKSRISYLYSATCKPLKVWNNQESLLKYYRSDGTQNFYTSNTYNNYNVNNDNSITINKQVYNDTDYETINNNNYTTINNTVKNYYEENNSKIDTSSVEDIIKKYQEDQAKRDQELLDKVEDNNNKTDEGNEISKETNEKLDKIYEILQQIASSLSGGDSGTSGSDFDMNTLIQMLNNLQLSLDTMWQVDLKQIQSNLNTIVNDLKSDNTDSKSILEDIYKTQQQILELQQANLNQNKTFFDAIIDYLKKITHALTVGNIIDTLDSLLNLKDDADGLSDFVNGIVGDIEPTVSLMKTKFPTSIPWDIIAVISVMACDPQTPKFEIPINIDIMGQKYEDVLVIDLKQFDRVARFGRALLSVMFTLWLLLITKRLLYGGES